MLEGWLGLPLFEHGVERRQAAVHGSGFLTRVSA
jgi:hypothetical protein